MKKLPIGIQDFESLITEGNLYVDKTELIHQLVMGPKFLFLSRPRRFGKSLTLSTIAELFRAKKELFKGLWIEDNWDWSKTNPVIHLSFATIDYQGSGLENALIIALNKIASSYEIELVTDTLKLAFLELIEKLDAQYGKVVLLLDEYDKPLIDYLDNIPKAKEHQKILKSFYSILKDAGKHLRLLLITGVSKFSKVSVFSDLNNLADLTLNVKYAQLTGYTEDELKTYFSEYISRTAETLQIPVVELMANIKEMYNGYSWDGRNFVYNPFSILLFLDDQRLSNFWFETGTPTFLINVLRKNKVYKLDKIVVDSLAFSSYDIEKLEPIAILFQTGYLTIKKTLPHNLYELSYPNKEVRDSMLSYLLEDYNLMPAELQKPIVLQLNEAFANDDFETIISILKSLFKNIPYQIFIAEAEAYYHSLIYLVFVYLGVFTEAEVNTNNGRLDCVVKTATHIYVIEFKLDKSVEAAMQQIREKGYAEKYRLEGRKVMLVGINFSSLEKTIEGWQVEDL